MYVLPHVSAGPVQGHMMALHPAYVPREEGGSMPVELSWSEGVGKVDCEWTCGWVDLWMGSTGGA